MTIRGRLMTLLPVAVLGFGTAGAAQEAKNPPGASVDRQQFCADAAREFMANWPQSASQRVEHTSRFSPSRDRCLVIVNVRFTDAALTQFVQHVFDPVSGQRIATLSGSDATAPVSIIWFDRGGDQGYVVSSPASKEDRRTFDALVSGPG